MTSHPHQPPERGCGPRRPDTPTIPAEQEEPGEQAPRPQDPAPGRPPSPPGAATAPVDDRSAAPGRVVLSRRARAGLWVLRIVVLALTAMVIYTFLAQLS